MCCCWDRFLLMGRLIWNHLDAWGVTLVIGLLVLVLHGALTLPNVALVVALGAGYWLAFALNDYFDAPFDAQDVRKARRNFFVGRVGINGRFHYFAALVAMMIAVVFATFGWLGMGIFGLGIFMMWAYSAPPLRLKNRPVLDLLTHTLFVETFPYTVTLILSRAAWTVLDGVILLILALASLTAQLEQQLRDFAVDAETGGTFATWAGQRRTNVVLLFSTSGLVLTAAGGVISGTIPAWLAPFGLIALPAMIHRFLRQRERPRSERLVRVLVVLGVVYMVVVLGLVAAGRLSLAAAGG